MGIDSSIMADNSGDPNVEPLPSLLELHQKISESGRLKKRDYDGVPKPPVSDIDFIEKKLEAETDSFGPQKPYTP